MRKAIAASCIAVILGCVQLNPKLIEWVQTRAQHTPISMHPEKASHGQYIPAAYQPIAGRVQAVPLPKDYPPCLDKIVAQVGERSILVDKSSFKASVYEYAGGTWLLEKSYPVSIGRSPGRKERTRDMKTPEGIYTIIMKMSTADPESRSGYLERLNLIHIDGRTGAFGEYALVLDYPTLEDRTKGYTGSGIMLHSGRDGVGGQRTNGCIALLPSDMKDLFYLAKVGTKVMIVPAAAR